MLTITNKLNLPLPIKFWLEHDEYDYDSRANAFSASSLVKSVKKTALSREVIHSKDIQVSMDISDYVGSRRGTAIHTAIEVATERKADEGWNIIQELRLEYPLEVDGTEYIITGKFDALIDGVPTDWKTESTYSFGDEIKHKERIEQLSVYAWLCHRNGYACSSTVGDYVHIFTNWLQSAAAASDSYPQAPIIPVRIPLMQREEVEEWMRERIRQHTDTIDPNTLTCSRDDLWLGEPVWQYFATDTSKKASKNFTGKTAYYAAMAHKNQKGKGVIKIKPQQATACGWCLGRFNCNQYEILKSQRLVKDED